MPFITVTVTGLTQCKTALNKADQNLPTAKQQVLNDMSQLLVREAKDRAHVISGDMRDSIAVGQSTSMQNNQIGEIDVVVGVDYASYENDRGEDHAFFTQAVDAVEQKGLAIIKPQYDRNFRISGVPLK